MAETLPWNLSFMVNVRKGIYDRKEQQESPISDKAPANLLSFGLWEQQWMFVLSALVFPGQAYSIRGL